MGSTPKNSTTATSLPGWLRPYAQNFIKTYAGEAFDIDPVTGQYKVKAADPQLQQQLAGFTPEQLAGMNQITSMSGAATGFGNQAMGENQATIRGDYLHPGSNPYLEGTFDAAAGGVTRQFQNATMPGLMAMAQRSGQFGSSAMNEALGDAAGAFQGGMNDLASNIYGGNYQNERNRQMQAVGMAPQTMATAYMPAYQNLGVGAMQQQQQQQGYDTNYMNAIQRSEYPFQILSGFGGALGQAGQGSGGSTTKSAWRGVLEQMSNESLLKLVDFGLPKGVPGISDIYAKSTGGAAPTSQVNASQGGGMPGVPTPQLGTQQSNGIPGLLDWFKMLGMRGGGR